MKPFGLILITALSCVAALEVVNVALQGETRQYHLLQDPNSPVVVCRYRVGAQQGRSRVVISKDGNELVVELAPTHPNPKQIYSVSKMLELRSGRTDEGLITCTIHTPDGETTEKSMELFIADTPVSNSFVGSQQQSHCSFKVISQLTPASDPPVHAKCGIFLFDSPDPAKNKGNWMEDSDGLKWTYSTENNEWRKIKERKQEKLIAFMLENVRFKLRMLPKNKRYEYRCKTYYKFGEDTQAVIAHIGTHQYPAMEIYEHRCPSLSGLPKIAQADLTLQYNQPKLNEDCQGMVFSKKLNPLQATLTCKEPAEENEVNGTAVAEMVKRIKVQCERDFTWNTILAENVEETLTAVEFAEACGRGGASSFASASGFIWMLAVALILLKN